MVFHMPWAIQPCYVTLYKSKRVWTFVVWLLKSIFVLICTHLLSPQRPLTKKSEQRNKFINILLTKYVNNKAVIFPKLSLIYLHIYYMYSVHTCMRMICLSAVLPGKSRILSIQHTTGNGVGLLKDSYEIKFYFGI